MKANPRPVSLRRPLLAAGALALLLAGCSAPPVPAPRLPPPPPPAPTPRPAAPVDWRDAPLAPGAWVLTIRGKTSQASYGDAVTFSCGGKGAVEITLPGPASPTPQFTIITSSLSTDRAGLSDTAAHLAIPARDALLDAIAFSRGRFAVEVEGRARLILPADPVISRVVEDCRAPR